MKKFLVPLLAVVLMALPVFALDPHDAQSVNVTNVNNVATTAPQTFTIATLTTHAVNSGTNSYICTANIAYEVPSGGQVSFQISKGGVAISAVRTVSNGGHITITCEAESVATSSVITIQAVANNITDPVRVGSATLTILGLAGATQ